MILFKTIDDKKVMLNFDSAGSVNNNSFVKIESFICAMAIIATIIVIDSQQSAP